MSIGEMHHKEILVEYRFLGGAHASCHMLGRTRQQWGDECTEELTVPAGHSMVTAFQKSWL